MKVGKLCLLIELAEIMLESWSVHPFHVPFGVHIVDTPTLVLIALILSIVVIVLGLLRDLQRRSRPIDHLFVILVIEEFLALPIVILILVCGTLALAFVADVTLVAALRRIRGRWSVIGELFGASEPSWIVLVVNGLFIWAS